SRHDELASCARYRDVEQPPLFGQQPADGGYGADPGIWAGFALNAARHDDDELVHAEQRAALAKIGPAAFLHTRDDDEVPFQSFGPVRRQHRHRITSRRTLGERVTDDLLTGDAVDEQPGRPMWQRGGEPGGRIEERDDGVKVGIGLSTARSS